jgi:hypothetical protein
MIVCGIGGGLLICLSMGLFTAAAPVKRTFHPYAIVQVTAENPVNWRHPLTHLQIEGWVTYKAHEQDGDWHLRICDDPKLMVMDAKHCLVGEIIPELPLPVPKLGAHVQVEGIYRFDAEHPGHMWAECHPILKIKELPQ